METNQRIHRKTFEEVHAYIEAVFKTLKDLSEKDSGHFTPRYIAETASAEKSLGDGRFYDDVGLVLEGFCAADRAERLVTRIDGVEYRTYRAKNQSNF